MKPPHSERTCGGGTVLGSNGHAGVCTWNPVAPPEPQTGLLNGDSWPRGHWRDSRDVSNKAGHFCEVPETAGPSFP